MPVDQYGIWYSGDLSKEKPATGGGSFTKTPGSQAGNFKEFQPTPGLPQFPQPGGGFEGTGVGELGDWTGMPLGFTGTDVANKDFGTGSQRGQGWMDFANSYTTGGAPAGGADKNKSGQGADGGVQQGYAGTPSIPVGAGQDRAAQNAALTQRNEMLRQLFMRLFGGGQPMPQVPTPPDLFSYAQTAIEAGRGRQQQELANEAAATGAAGSRDLAYRQGVVGSQALEALGRIAPQYQAQQFNLAATQAQNEYARQIAEFNQMIKLIAAMGGPSSAYI